MAQTSNDTLSTERDIKACEPSTNSHNNNTLEQHNNRDGLEKHVFISPPFDGQQNHDGSINAVAEATTVEMEEHNADDETFPNQNSTIVQSMLQENGQESDSPATWQNLHGGVNESLFGDQFMYDFDKDSWLGLECQDNPSFQNGQNSPLWSFDYGSDSVGFHTQTLGNDNALNWGHSGSISHTGNVNPIEAQNGGVGSVGISSTGLHPVVPNIQQSEATNLIHQRYEPFQPCSEAKSSSPEKIVDNDLDISDYLNLNNPDMDDTNWDQYTNQLWSKSEAKRGD
ncbi:uncharacterized protein LOC109804985 [Cajanus cajan]|uniref:uncharacterized protein LOC109804985 n=1 Tax=Cajanus cajan TaxID=3821 RepID=UPI0010FB8D70|nr:uncharacterized protein LOC109804985 [Cajanus cajan]